VFLGNIHPRRWVAKVLAFVVPRCVPSYGTSTHSFGSWTSRCLLYVFGGDFRTAAKYFEKKFTAPIHHPPTPLVVVFGPSTSILDYSGGQDTKEYIF